jgi:hypothetical protein
VDVSSQFDFCESIAPQPNRQLGPLSRQVPKLGCTAMTILSVIEHKEHRPLLNVGPRKILHISAKIAPFGTENENYKTNSAIFLKTK